MSAVFHPVSLLIEVDHEWEQPDTRTLRVPAEYKPNQSRILFHETLHYWQQLAQGFLIRLADEEWQRLLTYKNEKQIIPPGSVRQMFAKKEKYGFSAKELSESLASY